MHLHKKALHKNEQCMFKKCTANLKLVEVHLLVMIAVLLNIMNSNNQSLILCEHIESLKRMIENGFIMRLKLKL